MNFTNRELYKLLQNKIIRQFVSHIFDNNLIKNNKHCREFFRQFLLVHYPNYKDDACREFFRHEYISRIDSSVILFAQEVFKTNHNMHKTMYGMIRNFVYSYDKSHHTLFLFDKFMQLVAKHANSKVDCVGNNDKPLTKYEPNDVPLTIYSYDEHAHNEFLTENNVKKIMFFMFRIEMGNFRDMYVLFFTFFNNYVNYGLWQDNIYAAFCNYIKMMRFHNARRILKQYNPYVIFCNKFIIMRKNTFVWFCEQTYNTYKHVNHAERCCVDEVIVRYVHRFL